MELLWIYSAQHAFHSLTLTCSTTLIRHDPTTACCRPCLWHLDNRKFMATEEHIIGLNLIPLSPLWQICILFLSLTEWLTGCTESKRLAVPSQFSGTGSGSTWGNMKRSRLCRMRKASRHRGAEDIGKVFSFVVAHSAPLPLMHNFDWILGKWNWSLGLFGCRVCEFFQDPVNWWFNHLNCRQGKESYNYPDMIWLSREC